jgi:hypothetical protein
VHDWNADGRDDLLWAGGGNVDSSTLHFRLGLGDGSFGAAVNSGIAARLGLGVAFDANGDGRKDLLMRAATGNFAVAHGGPSGLQAAVDTGIAIPQGLRDLRGADLNGDGLGDLVWSQVPAPYFDDLKVYVRYALPAGGYGTAAILYSQREAMSYDGAEGGEFISARVDLDGDGAEDILMNENYSLARISASGHANDRFDALFTGLVALEFNDDDCADYAYKHITGYLRIRLGSCTIFGSSAEIQGPAWSGSVYFQVHDWNADGRDDLLLRGPVNWHVALSRGDSVAPVIDTGVPHEGLPTVSGRDIDGDGLQDFVMQAANTLRVRLRDGPLPDVLLAAIDGFGLKAVFTYKPLTDPAVHVAGSGARWPEQDVQTNDNVVALLKTTDGTGKGYLSSAGFRYEGLRRDARGRGILGFRKLIRTDLSAPEPLATEILQRQDYPFVGLPELVVSRRSTGKTVSSTEYNWSKLGWGSGYLTRHFPYPSTVTTRSFGSGGALDGAEIMRSVRGVAAIDPLSGLVTDETITTTEIAGGRQRRFLRHRARAAYRCVQRHRELVSRKVAGRATDSQPHAGGRNARRAHGGPGLGRRELPADTHSTAAGRHPVAGHKRPYIRRVRQPGRRESDRRGHGHALGRNRVGRARPVAGACHQLARAVLALFLGRGQRAAAIVQGSQ